jgi:hypothetical protein
MKTLRDNNYPTLLGVIEARVNGRLVPLDTRLAGRWGMRFGSFQGIVDDNCPSSEHLALMAA